MSRRLLGSLAVGLLGTAVAVSAWAEVRNPADANPPARKPLLTSKVTGSPEPPPPFKYARAWPNAKFDHPLLFAKCPGTDRVFVGEQAGKLYSLKNTPDAKPELFCDLTKEIKTVGQNPAAKEIGELYGLVFHPKFEQNRTAYVCYTLRGKEGGPPLTPDGSRVSRFKVTNTDPPRLDPATEEIVLTFVGGGHNGGDLHFGNDGMLYITTGDAASPNPPDPLSTGQDCSDLLSSILRIDVDKKDPGKNYAVPKDNPFVGMADVRPEIWAYGFRN
ncbi:MAG: PQQ-dependent sugar dehydrogenase, partial [Gemmataceae bacterium]|nr:PQQ-dependent sugar dehydrogenase [Gemmataceae bacterium]